MSLSVNTNYGALRALQYLSGTNSDLGTVQNRVNTGLAIASARDNGGTFAIAQSMRGEVAAYGAVQNSLSRVQSTVDVALAAGEAISDLLIEMKELAIAASDTSMDKKSRQALDEDFQASLTQISTIVSNAEFNGTNLLNNSTQTIKALSNADGSSTLDIQTDDFRVQGNLVIMSTGPNSHHIESFDEGPIITMTPAAAIGTDYQASYTGDRIEESLENVNNALARLGSQSKALEIHSQFVTKLADATTAGIGSLVDADMARESANLQALQVKQQLGVQALSIANSSPSIALGLFE